MSLLAVQRLLTALSLALGEPSAEPPTFEVHEDVVVVIEPARLVFFDGDAPKAGAE